MKTWPDSVHAFLARKHVPLYIHLAAATGAYPFGCRGYSVRTEPDVSVWITVLASQWLRLREHVKAGSSVAALITSGADNESYQLKGRFIDCRSVGREEAVLLEEQRNYAALHYPNLLPLIQVGVSDCVSIGLQADRVYAQTPGPAAGRLLQEKEAD
ncbi:hypothetical protein [Paenibacillus ginsengarvi]|uniref:Pyridoxamine 5'-phosphate oxidase family protein n=1 Tax=Paenibacillus ginsengarvi TaxID=400777 RepID=A0A3B0C6Z2_9BACL|nr:hypothetical protein [Paenibacillus ginsengarvi]RKN82005.1 hypothetical protein D7M11_18700 [Paenibacillus ginsengarvi]